MRKKSSRKKYNTISSFISFNKKTPGAGLFKSFGFILTLFLMFFYVFQVTEMARNINSIQAYNGEVENALEESKKSEYNFLKTNSVSQAEELVEELNFVRIEEAHYINVSDYQVASK